MLLQQLMPHTLAHSVSLEELGRGEGKVAGSELGTQLLLLPVGRWRNFPAAISSAEVAAG